MKTLTKTEQNILEELSVEINNAKALHEFLHIIKVIFFYLETNKVQSDFAKMRLLELVIKAKES